MNVISLAALTIIDAGPVEQIRAAAAAGFDAVGLRIVPAEATDVPVVGDAPLLREIKRLLADTGLSVLDMEVIRLVPDTQVAALLPALEIGAELGAGYVLVIGNDPDQGRTRENFASLCEAAAGFGLRVMLEFVPYRCVRTIEQAHQLIQETGPSNAGICVDALHLSRSGGSPAALRALDPSLFSYMQLCDARPAKPTQPAPAELGQEARTGRLYPGEGALELRDLLEALPAGLPLSIEAPCLEHAHLTPTERASLAGRATRTFLEGYYGDKSQV
jgi:sugar phosphate isomerase/epimerase